MDNYVDNNGLNNENNYFDYNVISGLGESNYENEDLFKFNEEQNNETQNIINVEDSTEKNKFEPINTFDYNFSFPSNENVPEKNIDFVNIQPKYYNNPELDSIDDLSIDNNKNDEYINFINKAINDKINDDEIEENNGSDADLTNYQSNNNVFYDSFKLPEETSNSNIQPDVLNYEPETVNKNEPEIIINQDNDSFVEDNTNNEVNASGIVENNEVNAINLLDSNVVNEENDVDSSITNDVNNIDLSNANEVVVEDIDKEENNQNSNLFNETPIQEMNDLTKFTEEKMETLDIKSLFDRVGVNVKEASDIFKKNTEMKEKIDSRFEELKKLQSQIEKQKQVQNNEINAYKEEVLTKLTEKKDEIEEKLNKLKEFQATLEKEKNEFEAYKKEQKAEIERVQKEVQDAYDLRREELNHVEDILRKQKDALDEERNQLTLDRIQYEADKNELANNLLKFNEIVDSFTSGVDNLNN